MKYIDADKLIAEIERRLEKYDPDMTNAGRELQEMLAFIDSLQQEHPEVDLEKEIDNYMYPIQSWEVQEEPFTSLEKCARHFYGLGLNARKTATIFKKASAVLEKQSSRPRGISIQILKPKEE